MKLVLFYLYSELKTQYNRNQLTVEITSNVSELHILISKRFPEHTMTGVVHGLFTAWKSMSNIIFYMVEEPTIPHHLGDCAVVRFTYASTVKIIII